MTTNNLVVGGNKFNGKPGFTNDTAIETRVVDAERGFEAPH
jgi:hypothetical protein